MSYILAPNGFRIYEPQQIADSSYKYCKVLYNFKDDVSIPSVLLWDVTSFIDKILLPKLKIEQLKQLNVSIKSWEILEVIHCSKLNKSQGPDGLYNKYYRLFKT